MANTGQWTTYKCLALTSAKLLQAVDCVQITYKFIDLEIIHIHKYGFCSITHFQGKIRRILLWGHFEAILPPLVEHLSLVKFGHILSSFIHAQNTCLSTCRHRAQGFQAGNGIHWGTGSLPTWLTPWRWAHSTVCLIIAPEQTNTFRLQVSALDDFYRPKSSVKSFNCL